MASLEAAELEQIIVERAKKGSPRVTPHRKEESLTVRRKTELLDGVNRPTKNSGVLWP